MSKARRVLVVSFFYPPDPAVGGRRVAKFVGYLPEFGWTPTVLTAAGVADATTAVPAAPIHATRFLSPWRLLLARRTERRSDEPIALRERLGRRGPLARGLYTTLRHVLPMSSVRMPDATLGWVPFALAEGRRLLASDRFDAILSSSGPPSSHLVAARLQRHARLPWVADYRDLWSDNAWDHRIPPFRWLERRLERLVLRRASYITTVARGWAERLSALHGLPVDVVYNGFDPSDYPATPPQRSGFVITYVGTLIRPQQNPEPLFAALAQLAARPDLDLDRAGLRVEFLGTAPGAIAGLAERHGVDRWVRQTPPVPHAESLARQASSMALLFLGWHDPAAGWLSAKLFEYLGARRPILAVGPPGGDASRILRECGIPDLTNDPAQIAARLASWLAEYSRAGQVRGDQDEQAVGRYTRRAQAGRLAQLLDAVVSAAGTESPC